MTKVMIMHAFSHLIIIGKPKAKVHFYYCLTFMEIFYIPGQPNHIIDFSWQKCKRKQKERQGRRETDGRLNKFDGKHFL
jgi:hypothetical protein